MDRNSLRDLAAEASPLFERLASDEYVCAADETVEARLRAWCQAATGGDWTQFERRLALDGLDVDTVRPALGKVRFVGEQLPAWIETFQALMAGVERGIDCPRCMDAKQSLPFEDALTPFVAVAVERLRGAVGYDLLTEEAHTALERSLLNRLSWLCDQALGVRFAVFQALRRARSATGYSAFPGAPSRREYPAFVEALGGGEWTAFFAAHPVLARLVSTAVDQWVNATGEFTASLQADRAEIQELFAAGRDPGPVAAIRASLSDPHNGGRTVLALTFSSGLKLVFKPKNLGLEVAYAQLQTWLNERGAPLPFKVLKVLDRSTYGWAEFIPHLPCRDEEEAKLYYRRAGALLSLLYALETTDCHYQNLIACGPHPILCDLETLMHSRVWYKWAARFAPRMAAEQYRNSVLRVGLLPIWHTPREGAMYDISGLGCVEEQTRYWIGQWRAVNTDRMERVQALGRIEPRENVALLHGRPLLPQEYQQELSMGFESMYRFLMAQREALLAANGPLRRLAGQQVRFLNRPTGVYSRLTSRLLHPRYLSSGLERSIQLDQLSRGLLVRNALPFWPTLGVEHRAMEQLDVPSFRGPSDSDGLPLDAEEGIAACFEGPGYHLARTRVTAMGEADLERQLGYIRGSLEARGSIVDRGRQSGAQALPDADAPDAGRLIETALQIARQLSDLAIRSDEGAADWIAPTYVVESEGFRLQPTAQDLYGGSPGIGLFLAALEQATGGAGFRDLALGTLDSLRICIEHEELQRALVRYMGIGGATGLGSMVYLLVRMGDMLNDASLHDLAGRAATLITPEEIAADRRLDVLGGAAGALLGLLTLYETNGDADLLARADACGRHVLACRTESESGHRVWRTLDGRLLNGFSHGSAGFAFALSRLYRATGQQAYLDAAQEAMAFERAAFVPAAGNWPDFRTTMTGDQPVFATSWCNGAAGIGLARLGLLDVVDAPEVRAEIDAAVQISLSTGVELQDHACCGNLGRIELLMTAAAQLDRPELMDIGLKQAGQVLARAARADAFLYSSRLPDGVFIPGFFMGASGIGYHLLRLADPERVPAVLLWA